MTLVSDLDLPVFGYAAPGAGRCHEHLAETRQQGWLAKSPLALDGPPQFGGVEGSCGIGKLPIIRSGPAWQKT